MGAALVIAKAIDGAIVPIFVALFLGLLAWGAAVTWGQRSQRQSLDAINTKLDGLVVAALAEHASLETHRREDAEHFARIDERFSIFDRIFANNDFWRKAAEDRARLT